MERENINNEYNLIYSNFIDHCLQLANRGFQTNGEFEQTFKIPHTQFRITLEVKKYFSQQEINIIKNDFPQLVKDHLENIDEIKEFGMSGGFLYDLFYMIELN